MQQKYQAYIWRQTVDGQLQPFSVESTQNEAQNDSQSVYKPSAYKPGDLGQKKFVQISSPQEFKPSTNVWTPQGYGLIKSISKQQNEQQQNMLQVKLLKQKNDKQQVIQIKQSQAHRRININARILGKQKVQLVNLLQIPISTKIESLLDLISALKQQQIYFIAAMAKSRILDKKKSLMDEQISHNDFIVFSLNSAKQSIYKRFKETSTGYWYIGSSWDAITFTTSKSIMAMGFGTYQHFHSANFQIKFNIYVNGNQVLTQENYNITSSQVKDKIGPVKFKNPINLAAGSKITIQMMHKNIQGQGNHAYYGNRSENSQSCSGNDSYITVQASDKDHNCTSVESGQIPQLYYIAC